MVCMPLFSHLTSTHALYGAERSVATRVPSTQNSTRPMPFADVASAVNRKERLTVESTVGATRVTAGPAAVTGARTVHEALAPGDSTLPAASVERTSTV